MCKDESLEGWIADIAGSAVMRAMGQVQAKPEYAGTIKKLRLEPGEVLCVFSQRALPDIEKAQIVDAMSEYFPNRKCLIFDEGVDLRVLHPDEVEEEESDVVEG